MQVCVLFMKLLQVLVLHILQVAVFFAGVAAFMAAAAIMAAERKRVKQQKNLSQSISD